MKTQKPIKFPYNITWNWNDMEIFIERCILDDLSPDEIIKRISGNMLQKRYVKEIMDEFWDEFGKTI